eukprot:13727247-Alexandrium_andersonii.AAC.1
MSGRDLGALRHQRAVLPGGGLRGLRLELRLLSFPTERSSQSSKAWGLISPHALCGLIKRALESALALSAGEAKDARDRGGAGNEAPWCKAADKNKTTRCVAAGAEVEALAEEPARR